MQISPYSWNGNLINDGTNFSAWVPRGQLLVPSRQGVYVPRIETWPKLSGAVMGNHSFTFYVQCLGTIHSTRDTLKGYFTPEDYTINTLVVTDANTSQQWYLRGIMTRNIEEEPGIFAVTLALDEPFYRASTTSTDSWTAASSSSTDSVTIGGNIYARPTITITPSTGKTGSYSYKRWIACYNPTDFDMANYAFDIAGNMDTAALVTGGKAQASGNDFRVIVDSVQVDRRLRDFNTTDTGCWISNDIPGLNYLTLRDAMTTDTITEIVFKNRQKTDRVLRAMDASPSKVLYIEAEAFTFTDVDKGNNKVTGVTRAAKNTTISAHATTDDVIHIPSDIYIIYGKSTDSAPELDDNTEPMFTTSDSSNTMWAYDNFYDSQHPFRPGSWYGVVEKSKAGKKTEPVTEIYTGNQGSDTDPASEMGMAIGAYNYRNKWQSETATVVWGNSFPAGVSAMDVTGEKYFTSTSWPNTAELQYSTNGNRYNAVWNETAPAATDSWEAFTSTDIFVTTAENVRFMFSGSVDGKTSDNIAKIEIGTADVYLVNEPVIVVGAETATYFLNCKITNQTTGEWIAIQYPTELNKTITIDCDAQTITYEDGTNIRGALTLSTEREDWFHFASGVNNLLYEEIGAAEVIIGFSWQDRATL